MTIRNIMSLIDSRMNIFVETENGSSNWVASCYNSGSVEDLMEELNRELECSIRAERMTAEEADNILDAEIVSMGASEEWMDIVVRF